MFNAKNVAFKYIRILSKKKINEPLFSIKFIMTDLLDLSFNKWKFLNFLYLNKRDYINLQKKVLMRMKSIPIQYILKNWYFKDLKIFCESDVLIPRPESEKIVDIVQENVERYIMKKNSKFLEIGIGTGVLFLSILKNNPGFQCLGLDINPKAIKLSQKNMKNNNIKSDNVKIDLVDFKDFTISNIEEKFDFIVSNPPYVSLKSKNNLAKELSYESEIALFSGEDGLDLIKIIILKSKILVKERGFVIIEFHPEQKNTLIQFLLESGIILFYFEKDFLDRERFLIYKIPK